MGADSPYPYYILSRAAAHFTMRSIASLAKQTSRARQGALRSQRKTTRFLVWFFLCVGVTYLPV